MNYYDRDGLPITESRVLELHADHEYVVVARTTVSDLTDLSRSYDVSTVWLGHDYSFGGLVPIIFETMVFQDSAADEACERYATEAEAKEGHVAMVVTIAATMGEALVMDVLPKEE